MTGETGEEAERVVRCVDDGRERPERVDISGGSKLAPQVREEQFEMRSI